jgi:hypothetical protein
VKKLLVAALALASAGVFTSAEAAIVTYTQHTDLTATPWDKDFTFNKFDTAQGTLVSVRFDLSGAVGGTYSFMNATGANADVTVTSSGTISLSSTDLGTFLAVNPTYSNTFTVAPNLVFNGVSFVGTPMTGQAVGASTAISSYLIDTSSASLALFKTTTGGTYTTHVDAIGSYGVGTSPVFASFTQGDLADVAVTYTFETNDVPEPASLALIAGGFGLMGAARRRNKKA